MQGRSGRKSRPRQELHVWYNSSALETMRRKQASDSSWGEESGRSLPGVRRSVGGGVGGVVEGEHIYTVPADLNRRQDDFTRARVTTSKIPGN